MSKIISKADALDVIKNEGAHFVEGHSPSKGSYFGVVFKNDFGGGTWKTLRVDTGFELLDLLKDHLVVDEKKSHFAATYYKYVK